MWSRHAKEQLSAAATVRLQHLSRQWRVPAGVSAEAVASPGEVDPPVGVDPWSALLADQGPASSAANPSGDALAPGPWSRSAVRGLVLLVAIAVAFAGWWWWAGRPREAVAAPTLVSAGQPLSGGSAPATTAPAPSVTGPTTRGAAAGATPGGSAGEVIVHVVGQVRHPGLVTLKQGSRVADAVAAAGGVTRPRAADSVNLARVLVDGEQVVVGFAAQAVAGVLGISPSKAGGLVNLNSADAATFEGLPGVGPVLAERIVQWRLSNGPFRSVDELGEVAGIGDAILAQLKPLVAV